MENGRQLNRDNAWLLYKYIKDFKNEGGLDL